MYLPKSLSSEFQTSPRQVTNLTSSARKTAVVEMNMSPGLIRFEILHFSILHRKLELVSPGPGIPHGQTQHCILSS